MATSESVEADYFEMYRIMQALLICNGGKIIINKKTLDDLTKRFLLIKQEETPSGDFVIWVEMES